MGPYFGPTRLVFFGSVREGPSQARDPDLARQGLLAWKLYELVARIEEGDRVPLSSFLTTALHLSGNPRLYARTKTGGFWRTHSNFTAKTRHPLTRGDMGAGR